MLISEIIVFIFKWITRFLFSGMHSIKTHLNRFFCVWFFSVLLGLRHWKKNFLIPNWSQHLHLQWKNIHSCYCIFCKFIFLIEAFWIGTFYTSSQKAQWLSHSSCTREIPVRLPTVTVYIKRYLYLWVSHSCFIKLFIIEVHKDRLFTIIFNVHVSVKNEEYKISNNTQYIGTTKI